MNLVDLIVARQNETPEEKAKRYKQEQKLRWKEEGNHLYEWRRRLGLTRTFIANETRVNPSRLRRLEQGLPVRDAKIICRSYEMVLEKIEKDMETEG